MTRNLRFAALLLLAGVFAAAPAVQGARPGKKKAQTVRLMDYNIADGMWYDQYNRYDRFVAWVRTQDPDVFAICEGATHWNEHKKTVSKEQMPRYLPDSLHLLAERWGHPYTAIGPYQDNYPVAFTSKYPIEVVQRIGEGLSHGALHVKINGVNYVVLHLWPQRYSMGDKTRKDNGGEAFRVEEMRRILDATILNPKFAGEKHWLMMGDFNSHSPLDKPFHGTRNYDVHDLVRSAYSHDIVGDWFSGEFVPSTTGGKARIDFIYCTDGIWDGVKRVETVHDAFTDKASDHRPIVVYPGRCYGRDIFIYLFQTATETEPTNQTTLRYEHSFDFLDRTCRIRRRPGLRLAVLQPDEARGRGYGAHA